jgi:hypothetical protein
MLHATCRTEAHDLEPAPTELVELRDRIRSLPPELREELEPIVEDVLDHARFRDRVLIVARDALERLRLDLEMARFDLEATRREREQFKRLMAED